jgi:hypothetical protein
MQTLHKFLASVLAFVAASFLSSVAAHAFFVTGIVKTVPSSANAGEAFTLQIGMQDPVGTPVEDAKVIAEFSKGGQLVAVELPESDTPGLYENMVTLLEEGTYQLLLRDQTFRQEEARATLEFTLGPDMPSSISFIFPPTATGSSNLSTWLIYVIGIPVVAGIIVTVLVLRATKPVTEESSEESTSS